MSRKAELTSLRGVAALWVFIYHIPIYLGFASLNTPILSSGYLGVPMFFILSISLLLKSLDQNPSLKHYFARRLKRIWPMYFATVVLIYFYYSHSLNWLVQQSTFSGVFIDNQSIQYIFWSLQIEELAYLFFPMIQKMPEVWKFRVSIALYFAGVSAFFLILGTHTAFELWWVPLSLSSYGIGILVYLKKVPSFTTPLLILAPFYWNVIPFEMASVFVIPAFGYVVQEASRIKPLRWRPLVWLGDNSYGLYLIHPFMLSAFGFFGVLAALPFAWGFERLNSWVIGLVSRDSRAAISRLPRQEVLPKR